MAFRFHMAAALKTPAKLFNSVVDDPAWSEPIQEGDWIWSRRSRLFDAEILDEKLKVLPGPGLRISILESEMWSLHLFHGGNLVLEAYLHLDLLSGNLNRYQSWVRRMKTEYGHRIDDFASQVFGLDPGTIGSISELPLEETVTQLQEIQAGNIADAIARAEIPVNRKTVIDALTPEGTHWSEQDGPDAHLALFLEAIGIRSVFARSSGEIKMSQRDAAPGAAVDPEEDPTRPIEQDPVDMFKGFLVQSRAELASSLQSARTDEIVLTTESATLYKIDQETLVQPMLLADKLETVEDYFKVNGFDPVAYLLCDRVPDVGIWGFTKPDTETYAVILGTGFDITYEFASIMEDGSLVITAKSYEDEISALTSVIRDYRQDIRELFDTHKADIEKKTSRGLNRRNQPGTPAGLADAVLAILTRRQFKIEAFDDQCL